MQLKMQTDYAIRILLYLTISGDVVSTKELSDAMGIAETYSPKIIKKLKAAELIISETGKDGGYRINKPASEINLFTIMEITEDTTRYNRCLEDDGFCSRNTVGVCSVHEVYKTYQTMTEAYFSGFTLERLLKEKK